jgi:hypothetical protein
LFMQVLFPPIIFEAAIFIDKQAFWHDLFPILMLAVLGTSMSALTIGYVTFAQCHHHAWFALQGRTMGHDFCYHSYSTIHFWCTDILYCPERRASVPSRTADSLIAWWVLDSTWQLVMVWMNHQNWILYH